MVINDYFEKVFEYKQQGLNFSALNLLKEIYQKEESPYAKIKYAHQLSVCGYYYLATKLFTEIDIKGLPKNLWDMKYLDEGRHFLRIGKIAKAKKAYLKSLFYRDDNTVPYVFASIACGYEKTQDEAIKILQSALDKEGDVDEVCYLLATLYLISGNINLALEYLNKSIEITPDYEIALSLKNDLLFYQSFDNTDFKENTSIEKLTEMAKECEENGQNFSAMCLWQIILSRKPTEFAKFRFGDQLRLCGDLNKAETILLEVKVNRIPLNYRSVYYVYLAQLYYDKYNWYKAFIAIKKALKYKSNSIDTYIMYAKILHKQEKNEGAVIFLNKGLNQYGADSEGYYYLATYTMIIGDIELALEYINCAIEIEPNYEKAHIFKNDILNTVGAGCQTVQKRK